MNTSIVLAAAVLMCALLFFEKREKSKGVLPVKTTLSLLFILTALIQPHLLPRYYHLVLVGLIFCLGGDVFLALPQPKMFLLGLVSFLVGHVFYVLSFFTMATISLWTGGGCLVTIVVSGGIYIWLKPHLGSMKRPVMAYVIVISIMVVGACSILGDTALSPYGRIMVFIGAVSFYFSDIFVARDRFLKNEFSNRLIGLPLYYVGQFLLAFSVGWLK